MSVVNSLVQAGKSETRACHKRRELLLQFGTLSDQAKAAHQNGDETFVYEKQKHLQVPCLCTCIFGRPLLVALQLHICKIMVDSSNYCRL